MASYGGAMSFDEMEGLGGDGAACRAIYTRLRRWLDECPPDLLATRRRQAELFFRRIGITFAVYGEGESEERLIPFDIVPRVIGRDEWAWLETGLRQRTTALNAFLRDVYGPRECLRAGIVPSDLVLQNPQFRLECAPIRPPHGVYVHIAGVDLVRTGEHDWHVLEDNARTPSGVSYMLENREVMMRLFPELVAEHRVRPVETYTDALLATLKSVAPHDRDDATIVVLTPGRFNSAYYEHSFLADKLGVELVEGADLFVDDAVVYMRTTDGPQRVDVIYRRLDDDFLDPLVFRPDSSLGVPGILGAYAAGNVTLANAVGTGVADDKAVYSYMPELIPLLHRRGRHPAQRADLALPRTERAEGGAGAPARARGEGGCGVGRLRHARGPHLDQGADRGVPRQAEGRARRLHRAAHPRPLHRAHLRGRYARPPPRGPAALRADGVRPHPHHPRRADARGADRGVAGRQLQPGRRHQGHLGLGRLMLSRTADNLYWAARYTERADFTARVLDAAARLSALPASYAGDTRSEWESALATTGRLDLFEEEDRKIDEKAVRDDLAFSLDNTSSIRSCLESARSNCRAVRTALTSETWEGVNAAWNELQAIKPGMGPERFARFVEWVKGVALAFEGSSRNTMLRNDAYWFLRLGTALERADNTARLLDVKYHLLLPDREPVGGGLDHFQWTTILREVSAVTAYRWVYRQEVKPWLVADLLMLNRQMPRSLASCYRVVATCLDSLAEQYGRSGPAQRQASAMLARLTDARIERIFQSGLHEFITDFIAENGRLGQAVYSQYLA